MTKKEITGKRSLVFSDWVRRKLPDSSTGFTATDVDFFLQNYKKKKLMMLEVKIKNGEIEPWQKILFENIEYFLRKGINDCPEKLRWKFYGFHTITFEKESFDDGKVYLDGKLSNEADIIKLLSMK